MARIFIDPYVGMNLRLGGPYGDITIPEASAIVGGEVAAVTDDTPSAGNSAMRSIGIGVATGALTFIVTRMLERFFK